jgi:hypothetical protein
MAYSNLTQSAQTVQFSQWLPKHMGLLVSLDP